MGPQAIYTNFIDWDSNTLVNLKVSREFTESHTYFIFHLLVEQKSIYDLWNWRNWISTDKNNIYNMYAWKIRITSNGQLDISRLCAILMDLIAYQNIGTCTSAPTNLIDAIVIVFYLNALAD